MRLNSEPNTAGTGDDRQESQRQELQKILDDREKHLKDYSDSLDEVLWALVPRKLSLLAEIRSELQEANVLGVPDEGKKKAILSRLDTIMREPLREKFKSTDLDPLTSGVISRAYLDGSDHSRKLVHILNDIRNELSLPRVYKDK